MNTMDMVHSSIDRMMDTQILQPAHRWQDMPAPLWRLAAHTAWFDVILPFLPERNTITWVQIQSQLGKSRTLAEENVTDKLNAFHDWLNSLPSVPPIPLEALDRGNLY